MNPSDLNREEVDPKTYKRKIKQYIKDKNWNKIAKLNEFLGDNYFKDGKITEAKKNYEDSVKYYIKTGSLDEIYSINKKIRNLYYKTTQFKKAIEYFEKKFEYHLKKNDWYIAGITKKIIGDLYSYNDDFDKALNNCKAAKNYLKMGEWRNYLAIINVKIGMLHFKQKKYNDAIIPFQEAYEINVNNENWDHAAYICLTLGKLYSLQEQFEEELKVYQNFIEKITKNIYWSEVAEAYMKIGKDFSHEGKFEEILKIYKEFIEFAKTIEDLGTIARAFMKIGKFYLQQGNLEKVKECYHSALEIDMINKDWENIAKTYTMIGNIYSQQKEFIEAEKSYQKSIDYNKMIKNWSYVARTYVSLGRNYSQQEKYAEAVECFQKSIEFNELDKDWENIAKSYSAIGYIYFQQELFDETINFYKKSIEYNEKKEEWGYIAQIYMMIGNVYFQQGKFAEAIENYQNSIKNDLKNNDWGNVAKSYMAIAKTYSLQYNLKEELNNYRIAITYDLRNKNLSGLALTYIKIGELYLKKGKLERGLRFCRKAIKLDLQNKNWEHIAKTYMVFGNIYFQKGNFLEAKMNYEKAFEYDLKNKNPDGISQSLLKIGKCYAQLEKFRKALRYFQKVLKIQIGSGNEIYIYKTRLMIASLYRKDRNWKKAFETYTKIADYLTGIDLNESLYFEIQALICQARIYENSSFIKEIPKIYSEIANKYEQLKDFWYAGFYNQINKIFKTDLLSQEGKHNECLESLLQLEKRLDLFLKDRLNEPRGRIFDLINFRKKQVSLFITRERAFISEEKNELDNSIKYFQKCSEISRELVAPRFKMDYRLYEGISIYYRAHAKRVEFQKLFKESKMNASSQRDLLRDEILPNFIKAQRIFRDLKQDLRERNISYEILLIEGKILELDNKIGKAFSKYYETELLLSQIDEEKAKLFSKSFKLLRGGRKGFPIEEFFLHKPCLGPTFIEYCDLPNIRLKQRFIHITFENIPTTGYLSEQYMFNVRLETDDEYFNYFENEIFYLYLYETGQEYKFLSDHDTPSRIFKFKIPETYNEGKKIFQIELLDETKSIITPKSFSLEYKEKSTEEVEEKLKEVVIEEFGKNGLKEIIDLINLENFSKIEDSLDQIINNTQEYEFKLFLDIIKKSLQGFNNYLEFHFANSMKKYIKIMNIDIHLLPSVEENFLKKIKEEYISKFLKQINELLKKAKINPKLKELDPLLLEVYEYRINNAFTSKKYTLTLQLTIAFFEKLMNKILFEKHNLDYNNINWDNFDDDFVEKYRNLFQQENRVEVNLRERLTFETARCLLMMLNQDILKFCNENSIIIEKVRKDRNDSYLEHGSNPIDEETANLCLKLLKDIKNYPESYKYESGLLNDQLGFFIEYIRFMEKIFFSQTMEEDDLMFDQEKGIYILESENLGKKFEELDKKMEGLQSDTTKIIKETEKIQNDTSEIIKGTERLQHDTSEIIEDVRLIKYRIKDFHSEYKEYKNSFDEPGIFEQLFRLNEKLNYLINSNRDKKLPKLISIHLANDEDKKTIKTAMKWLQRFWNNIKRICRLQRTLVLTFICENQTCSRKFRFIFFEKTKFGKLINIIIRLLPFFKFSSDLINFFNEVDNNISVLIYSQKKIREKIDIDREKLSSTISPSEVKFLYQSLFGIENENSRTLAETFNWVEENGKIKFYCNKCSI